MSPSPSERRQTLQWAATSFAGLVVAAASVVWMPNLAVYLAGLGLAALAAARVVVLLLEDRARRLGTVGIALIVALAILIPWQLAQAERSGSPRWTFETEGVADNLYVDGDRLLFSDDGGLHAVDLDDGKVLWSFDDISRVDRVDVAGDGHILLRSQDRMEGNEAIWLSPDGDQLWRSVADSDQRHLMGLALRAPLASSDGVLVAARCPDRPNDENDACTYVGIGPDGKERWEVPGYGGVRPEFEQQEAGSQPEDPQHLPEVVVIDTARDEGGRAKVVDAKDGTTVAEVDVKESLVVTGDTVLYESGPAGSKGTCRSHGLSRDGKVDWSAETPCLGSGAVVLGGRVYGVIEKVPGRTGGRDHPINDSFMIDTATGRWKMVGGLADFNLDSDATAGVAGADVVVQRDNQHLTGMDPDTGDTLWDLATPGDVDDIPGVSIAHGATVVLARAGRGHNPFYAGDDRSGGLTVLVIDSASGDVTGRRTVPNIWNSVPAGAGQAVLVDREELSLIGADSD